MPDQDYTDSYTVVDYFDGDTYLGSEVTGTDGASHHVSDRGTRSKLTVGSGIKVGRDGKTLVNYSYTDIRVVLDYDTMKDTTKPWEMSEDDWLAQDDTDK